MFKPGLDIPPADLALIIIAASLLGVGTVSLSTEKHARFTATDPFTLRREALERRDVLRIDGSIRLH